MARGVKAKTAEPARRARKPVPPAKAKAKVAAAKKPAAAAKPSSATRRARSARTRCGPRWKSLSAPTRHCARKTGRRTALPSCPRPGWPS